MILSLHRAQMGPSPYSQEPLTTGVCAKHWPNLDQVSLASVNWLLFL